MRIAVFMGGISSEKEISIRSGEAILESLQRQGYDAYGVVLTEKNMISAFQEEQYDLAYLALHGGAGENGEIQSVLELLGKKYTGSQVTACAMSMNKLLTKKIASFEEIRMAKTYANIAEIEAYPVMVKPSEDGSSVGIHVCNTQAEVEKALQEISGYAMIEEYIQGEELTVGVLHGKALGVLKIIPKAAEIYDYESKYALGGSVHEFPARIAKTAYEEAMLNAVKIHKALGMKGVSRSDFILKDDQVYFLEVNACPGMTKTSLIPDLATLQGYTFDDITRMLVEEALA